MNTRSGEPTVLITILILLPAGIGVGVGGVGGVGGIGGIGGVGGVGVDAVTVTVTGSEIGPGTFAVGSRIVPTGGTAHASASIVYIPGVG